MSKYGELRSLFELAFEMASKANAKPLKAPHKLGRSLKKKDLDFDPFELLQKEKERVARFEQRVKDWDKLQKKDDKKDEKKPTRVLYGIEWFIIGVLSYPVIGYLQTLTPVLK